MIGLRHFAIMLTHNWLASLKKFCRLKVLLIQFFPVALSVIFLLVYSKCNFTSVLKIVLFICNFINSDFGYAFSRFLIFFR